MNPIQALSDDEIDELDEYLVSDDVPENCMDISTLDGFFAALVVNPEFVLPSEYLPWIWDMEEGEDTPAFASVEQANHIMQLLMRYYNSVLTSIESDTFSPLFFNMQQEDGSEFFDAEGWCEGFMHGVFLYGEPWKEIFEEHPEFLAPMVLLGTEQGWELLEKSPDMRQTTIDAYESIADAVALLYDHFSVQRQVEKRQGTGQSGEYSFVMEVNRTEMSMSVIDANGDDPCPCGSGEKFSMCCGVPPTIH